MNRRHSRAAAHVAPGARVDVLVRPETIALGSQADGSENLHWNGRVKEMVFRGSHRSIAVETAAQLLRVEAPSQYPVTLGENVTLTAPATTAWAIVA